MNRCDCLIALVGALLGIFALIFACTALSSRNWEIKTNTDDFRSSSTYLSRIMSIFSLIFTCIGILTSLLMMIKNFSKYWNFLSAGSYFLACLTILLVMIEASRLIHHNDWPSNIYSITFSLLLLGTQIMSALAGKIIIYS